MKSPSAAEPVSELRRIQIVENGEPLVNYLDLDPELRQDRPRFDYRRESLLRQSVAERLVVAHQALLREGFRLHVVEGWRPPFIQRRMYQAIWQRFAAQHPDWSEVRLKRVVNKFSAPMNPRVPPPHTTGGAMDLALYTLDGRPCDMQRPFAGPDYVSFPFAAPGLGDVARRNRDLLAAALTDAGITNYPSEFWHWSYGDQGWAYRGSHSHAIYGPVEPPGWSPDPRDDVQGPLVMVDDLPAA